MRQDSEEAGLLSPADWAMTGRLATRLSFNKSLSVLLDTVSVLGEFMGKIFIHSFKYLLRTCQNLGIVLGNGD